MNGIYCPDCGRTIAGENAESDRDAFVTHREAEHPPAAKAVSGAGAIASQAEIGTPGGGR